MNATHFLAWHTLENGAAKLVLLCYKLNILL